MPFPESGSLFGKFTDPQGLRVVINGIEMDMAADLTSYLTPDGNPFTCTSTSAPQPPPLNLEELTKIVNEAKAKIQGDLLRGFSIPAKVELPEESLNWIRSRAAWQVFRPARLPLSFPFCDPFPKWDAITEITSKRNDQGFIPFLSMKRGLEVATVYVEHEALSIEPEVCALYALGQMESWVDKREAEEEA